MRRTASEIINDLEIRVARLERTALVEGTPKVAQLHIQAKSYDRVFYSPKPFTSFRNVSQDQGYTLYEKPKGLWYSCGKDWKSFVQSNDFKSKSHYQHKYLLEVNLNRMCVVRTEKELLKFSEKYGELEKPDINFKGDKGRWAVDWNKVSRDYDGIEICPYIDLDWSLKNYYRWYYGWDVASGCIWGKGAIKDITEVDSDMGDNEFRY